MLAYPRVSATGIVICALVLILFSPPAHTQTTSCFVTTPLGAVQGADRGASCAFLGIPFAAPPIGQLRWKPPQPVAAWNTVLDATTPPSSCASINPAGSPGGSENCLKLNIWTPDPLPLEPAPVIVWLHTGSFVGASANFASHNGQRLAEETGAIVVAPNYRLGAFGFLAHAALAQEDPAYPSSGNYGLLDQRAALTWVRDHIARFGGDPDRVALAGTSAGADSVGFHLVSPRSAGLFHRAIIESGTPTLRWKTHAEAASQGEAFASALGCTVPAQLLSCLRTKTQNQVLLALPQAAQQMTEPAGRAFWQPVVDGVEIPEQPRTLFEAGAFHQVPTIVGTNGDEAAGAFLTRSFPAGVSAAQYEAWVTTEFEGAASEVFATYPLSEYPSPADALARIVGDGQFVCEARRLTRAISATHTPAYLYSYEYVIDEVFPGRAIHGVESNIIFGNPYVPMQFPNHVLTPADLALHESMAGYWTRFASTGTPNTEDDTTVRWPLFRHPLGLGRGADRYILFDAEIGTGKRLREPQCDFWEGFFLRTMLGDLPAAR
jgi:para-nitrobenzyl esterase